MVNHSGDPNGSGEPTSGNNDTGGMVSASDLAALKSASASEIADLKAQVQTLTGGNETLAKERDSLTAAKTAVEERMAILAEFETKNSDLAKRLETTTTELGTAREEAVSSRRKAIVDRFKVPEDKVKEMTLDQLIALESVLPSAAVGDGARGLDINGSGGGDLSNLSARDKIKAGQVSQN
jgi:hypothetical protein